MQEMHQEHIEEDAPLFGFVAGVSTAIGFLPHIIFMLFLLLLGHKGVAFPLLLFTVFARVLGDWVFWGRLFPSRMEKIEGITGWRSIVSEELLSKASSVGAIFDMIIDASVDVVLIWMAFKASASPLLTLIVFCICQAIAAPLQGMMSVLIEKRYLRRFSMIIAAVATLVALEVNGVISHEMYIDVFGLSYFSTSSACLIILGAKCLLTGVTVFGKDTIAKTIQSEALISCKVHAAQKHR